MDNRLIKEKEAELSALRLEIDEIDGEICALLKRRFSTCEKIKSVKDFLGKSVTDLSRESAVNGHIAPLFDCEAHKNSAKNIYKTIIEECKILQTNLLKNEGNK